ncbi:paeninodin family lasso peptide [Phosphitispora sp. TUW77]
MKKEWQKPAVEVLDIAATKYGSGVNTVDWSYQDDDEEVFLHANS